MALDTPKILIMDEPTKGIDVGKSGNLYHYGRAGATGDGDCADFLGHERAVRDERSLPGAEQRKKITGEFVGEDITQENVMRAAIAS